MNREDAKSLFLKLNTDVVDQWLLANGFKPGKPYSWRSHITATDYSKDRNLFITKLRWDRSDKVAFIFDNYVSPYDTPERIVDQMEQIITDSRLWRKKRVQEAKDIKGLFLKLNSEPVAEWLRERGFRVDSRFDTGYSVETIFSKGDLHVGTHQYADGTMWIGFRHTASNLMYPDELISFLEEYVTPRLESTPRTVVQALLA